MRVLSWLSQLKNFILKKPKIFIFSNLLGLIDLPHNLILHGHDFQL
jgi:hypothetical protein